MLKIMAKKSTYGLKPEQLGRLLSMGPKGIDSVDAMSDEKKIEALLRDRLTGALPKDSSLLDSLLAVMERLARDIQSLAGKSFGDVLLDPASDVGLLQAIKDYSKKLSSTIASEAESAIAITMYYAAIASCLVHHDKKITQHSYKNLDQSFATLTEKKWLTPELKELFSQARKICQQRGQVNEKKQKR